MIRKRFRKEKPPLTFKQSVVITLAIHVMGLGIIWYSPIIFNKATRVLSAPGPAIKQPVAPYSDALERAFLTLQEWSNAEKQLAHTNNKNNTTKHK